MVSAERSGSFTKTVLIRPGVEVANLTDIGCHRAENEDYLCYAEPESDADFHKKGRIAVVADGMGGHQGGKIASAIAVETVRAGYLNYPNGDPGQALRTAFENAHTAIQEHARQHPGLRGMGTTCTAATLIERDLWYGHVGDSRLYLVRGDEIMLLTQDHSHVARMVQEGLITREEASVHPRRNVLTAAMGVETAKGDFSMTPLALLPGDILLMMTDGLHGLVNDHELQATVESNAPEEACRALVQLAKDRGGFDNITVQILKIV